MTGDVGTAMEFLIEHGMRSALMNATVAICNTRSQFAAEAYAARQAQAAAAEAFAFQTALFNDRHE